MPPKSLENLSKSFLNELFCFEKSFEMPYLPHAGYDENRCLSDRPPENARISNFACLSESLLSESLVILFFLDLLHLIKKLSNAELEFGQFVFRGNFRVIVCVLADQNVQMNAKLAACKRKVLGKCR